MGMACTWSRVDLGGTLRKWERAADQMDYGLRETVSPILGSVHFTLGKLYSNL